MAKNDTKAADNKTTEKKSQKKGGAQRLVAGTTGAVIGAAIGGIAGVMLADEDSRRKLGETVDTLTEKAVETAGTISENEEQIRDSKDKILDTFEMKGHKKAD